MTSPGEAMVHTEPDLQSSRTVPQPLLWRARSTSVCYVSECGRYEISVHHGRLGARYVVTFFESAPRRRPAGLFNLRQTVDEAFADAQHHARTGEVRS